MPEDPLHEPAHRARQAKRRVGHGKADAILVLVRTGAVIELGICNGNVAPAEMPGDVGKSATQDQGDLGTVMRV